MKHQRKKAATDLLDRTAAPDLAPGTPSVLLRCQWQQKLGVRHCCQMSVVSHSSGSVLNLGRKILHLLRVFLLCFLFLLSGEFPLRLNPATRIQLLKKKTKQTNPLEQNLYNREVKRTGKDYIFFSDEKTTTKTHAN